MTVTTTTNYKEYQADGIATVYAIPFLLLDRSDLLVYLNNQLITTGYTISRIGEPISQITFAEAPNGLLLLQRRVELLRDTDYQENGDLLASTLNKDFDRIYLILQGTAQKESQSLRVEDADGINPLPFKEQRSNKILSFDNDGQPLLVTAETGSALELAKSLADSKDNSKGAALVGYSDDNAYPAKTVGGKLLELKDNLIPMFKPEWWPYRLSIPNGYIPADGQELSSLTYPDMAQALLNGVMPTITEQEWQADPTKRGCYVAESRQGYFRVPDYNGMQADSLGALFFRGDNGQVPNGFIQLDGIGDASIPVRYTAVTSAAGANWYDNKKYLSPALSMDGSGYNGASSTWDIKNAVNKINLGTSETRPINVSGCWIIRTFGAVVNLGSVDLQQLINENAAMAARLSVLESYRNVKRFTYIYPNDGTEENPAIVEPNKRYILDNPFPNEPVICIAEVFYSDMWGETGWFWSNNGYGIRATQVIESDVIVVQTGGNAVGWILSAAIGNPFGTVSNALMPSAPCRVKVWRII